jgi:hypothetical protein
VAISESSGPFAVGNGSGCCEKVQKRYRSLYSSGLAIYRMTRPHWPLHYRADSGAGLSEFLIFAISFTAHLRLSVHMHSNDLWLLSPSSFDMMVVAQLNFMGSNRGVVGAQGAI